MLKLAWIGFVSPHESFPGKAATFSVIQISGLVNEPNLKMQLSIVQFTCGSFTVVKEHWTLFKHPFEVFSHNKTHGFHGFHVKLN